MVHQVVQTHGERAVFRMIRRSPGISRVELGRATKLTSAAVTQIVKRFIAAGLVRESEARNSTARSIGRSRVGLLLHGERLCALGITVRRFDVLYGLVTMDGKIKYSWKDEDANLSSMVDRLVRIRDLVNDEGFVLITTGVGLPTFSVPWSTGHDIIHAISTVVGMELYFNHNGSYAALAEDWCMDLNDLQSFFYVFFGSGIGGASVYRSGRGLPVITVVEAGHVGIDPHGELCYCGNRGCVELNASPMSLFKKYHYPSGSDLKSLMNLDMAAKRFAGESLAYGLVSIANILNTQTVILGGYDEDFLEAIYGAILREILAKFVTPSGYPLSIVTSKLGEFVGVQGAALGAIDQVGERYENL